LTCLVLTIIERQMMLSAVEAVPDLDLSGQQSLAQFNDALVYTVLSVGYMTATPPTASMRGGGSLGQNRLGRGLRRTGLRRR
jgi:hypothetical protein